MKRQILGALVVVAAVAGCTWEQEEQKPAGPRFVKFTDHNKERLAGTDYAGIAGVTDGIHAKADAGSEYQLGYMFWVEGPPVKGVQVALQGDAFKQGLLAPASSCKISLRKDNSNTVLQEVTAACMPTAAGAIAQFPDLEAHDEVNVEFTGQGLKNGNSEYSVMITNPAGKAAPCTVSNQISVWPKQD